MGLEVKKCSSCRAEIIWATTENGKRMPLDAVPVRLKPGMYVLRGTGSVPQAVTLGKHLDTEPLFMNHWATCPNASSHRGSS